MSEHSEYGEMTNSEKLINAAAEGDTATVQKLLSKSKDAHQLLLDSKTHQDYSALHLAAMNGHAEVVRVILQTQPSDDFINAEAHYGSTALGLATGPGFEPGYGHKEVVQVFLDECDRSEIINARNMHGSTALLRATPEILEVLLTSKTNPIEFLYENQLKDNIDIFFFTAIKAGLTSVVKDMLNHPSMPVNLSIDKTNHWEYGNELAEACQGEHVEVFKLLLPYYLDDNGQIKLAALKNVLPVIAETGNTEIMGLLLEKIQPGQIETKDLVPHIFKTMAKAMRKKKPAIVKQLLNHNAMPVEELIAYRDETGLSLLFHAASSDDAKSIELIFEKNNTMAFLNEKSDMQLGLTPFLAASRNSNLSATKALLKASENFTENERVAIITARKGAHQETALMMAVKNACGKGHPSVNKEEALECVKAILSVSTATSVVNAKINNPYDLLYGPSAINQGDTALHIAVHNNGPEVVAVILEANSSIEVVNTKNEIGLTPLMRAIKNDNLEIVKLLVEKCPAIELFQAKDSDGNTALSLAQKKLAAINKRLEHPNSDWYAKQLQSQQQRLGSIIVILENKQQEIEQRLQEEAEEQRRQEEEARRLEEEARRLEEEARRLEEENQALKEMPHTENPLIIMLDRFEKRVLLQGSRPAQKQEYLEILKLLNSPSEDNVCQALIRVLNDTGYKPKPGSSKTYDKQRAKLESFDATKLKQSILSFHGYIRQRPQAQEKDLSRNEKEMQAEITKITRPIPDQKKPTSSTYKGMK